MNFEKSLAAVEKSRLASCAFRFFGAAILSSSQIFGGYAPFSVAFVAAAGAGMDGLAALLGLLVGSLLFMPFLSAMKYIAIGILIFSAALAFFDTKFYQKAFFMPVSAVLCTASVGFVYLSPSNFFTADGANFLLELFLVAGTCICYRTALSSSFPPSGRTELLCHFALTITLFISLAAVPFGGHFSLGRIFTLILVLAAGRLGGLGLGCATAICAGLAMDSVSGVPYFCVAYSLSAVAAGIKPCGRALYTLLFLCGTFFSLFWLTADQSVYILMETAIAGVIFLLLPEKWFRRPRKSKDSSQALSAPKNLEAQLRTTAAVFRNLYDALTHHSTVPANDENIALVFDRSADLVCRSCPLCGTCWDSDYVTTYNALNDTTKFLTERGHILPSDFPSYFSARCIRLSDFIASINAEFTALLMRRQYTRQLDSTRQNAKEQYARLADLLSSSADQLQHSKCAAVSAAQTLPLECEISTAVRPKGGESVSGDTISTFRTDDGKAFLLLSDGMGCGESARRESAMTVRLLEQFLNAGIEPATALKTLNTALTLHRDENGSFTTIDLMVLTLQNGSASFYKYGAAPSYIRHGSSIRRITGNVLPAGLSDEERIPDITTICLTPGDLVLLASDGFVDSTDDAWLHTLLAQWNGTSLQALTSLLMDTSTQRTDRSDDASLLLLQIPASPAAVKEV